LTTLQARRDATPYESLILQNKNNTLTKKTLLDAAMQRGYVPPKFDEPIRVHSMNFSLCWRAARKGPHMAMIMPKNENTDAADTLAGGKSTQTPNDPNAKAFDDFSDRLAKASHDHAPVKVEQSQGQAMSLGIKLASELVAALIVGGALGYGADLIFDTSPLFLLVGLALGLGAAFLSVLRMMKTLSKEQQSHTESVNTAPETPAK